MVIADHFSRDARGDRRLSNVHLALQRLNRGGAPKAAVERVPAPHHTFRTRATGNAQHPKHLFPSVDYQYVFTLDVPVTGMSRSFLRRFSAPKFTTAPFTLPSWYWVDFASHQRNPQLRLVRGPT